jgi:hypothetical protein
MTPIFESQALQDTLDIVKENCINSIKATLGSAGFACVTLENPIVCEYLTNGESSIITQIDVANELFVVEDETCVFYMAFTDTNVSVLITVLKAIEEQSYEEETEDGE